jgi:hypothetical protein
LVGGNLSIQILPGHVLITRDPIVDRTPSGLIVLPPHYEELSVWAYVHLHEPGAYWDYWGGEPLLSGCKVVIEKLAGRPFTLHGLDLWLLPEHSILAVLEDNMFRDDLKAEIGKLIDEAVPENTTLTDDNLVAIEQALEDLGELVAEADSDGEPDN